jgi:hypothetical protein
MRTLRDVQVFHEAFAIPFHHGPQRDSDLFTTIPLDPNATYQSVADTLKQKYEGKQLVFAKEMACCLKRNYNIFLQDGTREFQQTFLIRNPFQVARSLINCGYFVAKEFGIKELYELYNFVVENLQPCPVIIDAEDLLEFPDEMMRAYCDAIEIEYEVGMTTWQPGPVPGWDREVCAGWHDSVMKSSGFVKRSRRTGKANVDDLSKEAIEVIEECMPCYEAMFAKRIIPKP